MVVELLASVIVGLIVTLASHGFVFGRRRLRDRRLERRYPVAGHYCTVFEDVEDGQIVTVKANPTFSQHGLELTGRTTNVGDGRSWTLKGSIVPGGRIHGTYIADDPNDPGLGGFFLQITAEGGLDGAWAGFDTENKQVTSGRYRFWKATDVSIRMMTVDDLPVALAILGEALGQRYVTLEQLSEYTTDRPDKFGMVAVRSDGRLVGAATATVTTSGAFLEHSVPAAMRTNLQRALPNLEFHRVGVLKSVAVVSGVRGGGIGTSLAQAVTDELWHRGATCIVAIGWTDHTGCHIGGTLESLRFRATASLEDFWKEESIERGYSCPTCGNPCECEAKVYFILHGDARVSSGGRGATVAVAGR